MDRRSRAGGPGPPFTSLSHLLSTALRPLLILTICATASCGLPAFLKAGERAFERTEEVAKEAREGLRDVRDKATEALALAGVGTAGAVFTVFKTIRRIRKRPARS